MEDQSLAEDFQCDICGDGETTSTNLIVMCDGCDLAVHQDCYGVPHIPEGPWLCRRCYVGGGEGQAQCCLCPWPEGALKQTTDAKRPWAHLLCARFLGRETAVLNAAFQEPIDISGVHAGRAGLACIYCRRKGGAPIQCASKTCHLAFHPLCARRAGAHLDLEGGRGFCWKHSVAAVPGPVPAVDIARPGAGRGRGGSRARSRPVWLMEPIAPRVILDRLLASPDLLLSEGEEGHRRLETLAAIARYWALRRSAKRGLPLLRRLQMEPWSSLTPVDLADPAAVADGLSTRHYLLADLRRLSRLTEALLEREKTALRSFSSLSQAFQLATEPLQTILRLLLRRAVAIDVDAFFHHPVSREEVPDYLEVIASPMDMTTMASRLEAFEYETLEAFAADLDLISANAMTYNGPETVYYRAAEALREAMAPLLDKARRSMEAIRITRNGELSQTLLKPFQAMNEAPKRGKSETPKRAKSDALGPKETQKRKEAAKRGETPKRKESPKRNGTDKPVETLKIQGASTPAPMALKNGQAVWAAHPIHHFWPARIMNPSRLLKSQHSTLPPSITRALKEGPIEADHRLCLLHLDGQTEWMILHVKQLHPLTDSFRQDMLVLEERTGKEFKPSQAMKSAHRALSV